LKDHNWSAPLDVYEGIYGYKCKHCGAVIEGMGPNAPTYRDVRTAKLPKDCDLSVAIVVHEEYQMWDEETWNEEDFQKYKWLK
jgi:hypothetical protein